MFYYALYFQKGQHKHTQHWGWDLCVLSLECHYGGKPLKSTGYSYHMRRLQHRHIIRLVMWFNMLHSYIYQPVDFSSHRHCESDIECQFHSVILSLFINFEATICAFLRHLLGSSIKWVWWNLSNALYLYLV